MLVSSFLKLGLLDQAWGMARATEAHVVRGGRVPAAHQPTSRSWVEASVGTSC